MICFTVSFSRFTPSREKQNLVDVSIFYFARRRGRGSPRQEGDGGGGMVFLWNPKGGVSQEGGVVGADGPGGCLQGIWGGR